MARRNNKAGLADGVVALVSALPWWVGMALAPVTYVVFHHFSAPPEPVATLQGQAGAYAAKTIFATLAGILQYLLPVLCLIGAGLSAWQRRDRAQLVRQAAGNRSASVVDGLSWQRFEHLVGESFRRQGFSVKETGGAGADGGVDLELRRGGELHLVQCKHWKALKVGVEVVRELYGAMAARGAASGCVVTSGHFTAAARDFAAGRNLRLIDGAALQALLRDAQRAPAVPAPTAVRPTAPQASVRPAASAEPPACPQCGQAMVRRTATRGAHEGRSFWGCTGFPACRGTRP